MFWEGVTPLRLGSLPHLQDAVAVVGYPIGGDTISVTSGAKHPAGNVRYTAMAAPYQVANAVCAVV